MCLMLDIATHGDSPLRNSPELSVEEVEASRDAVRQWFSLPFIHFIGSHTGCSCGFPHVIAEEPVEYWEGMFNDGDRETDLRSVDSLLVLLREHVAIAGEVELYPVWDGEEEIRPKGLINVDVESLNRETVFLNERFFYRVTNTARGRVAGHRGHRP
jgi:hypothetical protein